VDLPATFFDDYRTRSRAAKEQEMEVAHHLFLGYDLKLPLDYVKKIGRDSLIVPGYDAIGAWQGTLHSMTPQQRMAWDAAYGAENKAFIQDPPKGKELAKWKYERYIKDYLRCVASLDENIGRLLEYLDRENLAENTVVIYTSDQGFFLGEHGWFDKRFMYEPSLGIPLVMRYPGSVPGGSRSSALVLNLDFAPTILEFAGIAAPDDMQGRSIKSLAEGRAVHGWRSSIYYHYTEYPHGWHMVKRHYGIRTERYKLIHFYNDIDAWELYDLKSETEKMKNLYNNPAYAATVRSLKEALTALRIQFADR
jgi:arylsulfatase A-like enzyme